MSSLRNRITGYVKKKLGIDRLEKALGDKPPSSVSTNVSERKQLHQLDSLEGKPKLIPAEKRKKIKSQESAPVGNYYMRGGKIYKPKGQ